MNDLQINKLQKFANDKATLEAVKAVLLGAFLKTKPKQDVYQLAASRIAIDLLEEAWKDLEKYQNKTSEETKERGQIGL